MRNSDNLLYKNNLATELLFDNVRFKENNIKEGDWNNIMNKITDIAQGKLRKNLIKSSLEKFI